MEAPARWYVNRTGQRYGPYSFEQLKDLSAGGTLLQEDLLIPFGAELADAVTAGTLPDLFPEPEPLPTLPAPGPRNEAVAPGASAPVARHAAPADKLAPTGGGFALWNPNGAASWSFLLTPIFGAYLQAENWRALGSPDKARKNLRWAWAVGVFLIINLVITLNYPSSWEVDTLLRATGLALLLGWYFTLGKAQAHYVQRTFPGGYPKKAWAGPLLIGGGGVTAYLLAFFLAASSRAPDPNELAGKLRPLIHEEWRKKDDVRGAWVKDISLVHKGGKEYSGFVDALIAGKTVRLHLDVVYDRGNLLWQITPVNENEAPGASSPKGDNAPIDLRGPPPRVGTKYQTETTFALTNATLVATTGGREVRGSLDQNGRSIEEVEILAVSGRVATRFRQRFPVDQIRQVVRDEAGEHPETTTDPLQGETILHELAGGVWTRTLVGKTPTEQQQTKLREMSSWESDDLLYPEQPVSRGSSWVVDGGRFKKILGPQFLSSAGQAGSRAARATTCCWAGPGTT